MISFPEWQHKLELTKPYPNKGYGKLAQIMATAGLHYLSGNERPYFSLTGTIYIPGRRDIEAGGTLHDDLLKVWPELKPLADIHLSTDLGIPMHAKENAWYWLAGYYDGANQRYHGGNSTPSKTPHECLLVCAKHLRVRVADLKLDANSWKAMYGGDTPYPVEWDKVKGELFKFIERLVPRWNEEAKKAVELLERLRT